MSDEKYRERSKSRIPEFVLTEPRFIVRVGQKYYLTLAAWEYDETQATTEEQIEGCRQIAALFEESQDRHVASQLPCDKPHISTLGTAIHPPPNLAVIKLPSSGSD